MWQTPSMVQDVRKVVGAWAIAACLTAGCTPADNAAAGAKSFFSEVGDKVTDASISFAINAAYMDDALVKSKQIKVSTTDGVVTLKGTQPTLEAKARAIEIARGTKGVTAVYDGIVVQGMGPAPGKPASTTAPAASAPSPVTPPADVWQ